MNQCRHERSLAVEVHEAEGLFSTVSFEEDLRRYRLPESEIHWLRVEPYYKGLASFVKLSGARRVLEIGTLFGGSAIALGKYAQSVIAADVDLKRAEESNLFASNIHPYYCPSVDACLEIPLEGIEFIFVDIDHSGEWEKRLHRRFTREFQGTVFYDDISLNPGMREFWARVELEKVSIDWHHSGFGAVRYRG